VFVGPVQNFGVRPAEGCLIEEPVETIPYFHALVVFACKSKKLYRVYVRPDALVFIWAGSGTEVRIGKLSDGHARMYSDHGHQALLYLRHHSLGKYLLGVASAADVRVVMKELPRVLGDVYSAELEPPEHDQKCGCVFCAR
jgi:hypothetical protein